MWTGFAVLAGMGLYGTMAYSVAQRTNEIGVRMGFGGRWRVIRMVLGEVGVMAGLGLMIGVPVALGTTRLVKSFLFEVQAGDMWMMAVLVLATGDGQASQAALDGAE